MEQMTRPLFAIVDDDISVCRALKRLLRSLGMNAKTFSSAEALLELLDSMPSFRPDCLILDVQMPAPGMNGLELQSQLAGQNIPIVFMTAHDEPGTREQALRAGAIAFLRKPFNDELFVTTIQAALAKARKGGAP
jgi:FixJ family two-component response regulator